MIKAYIEGKNINVYGAPSVYNVSDGSVFVENYNETLDSGTILIQQLDSEIDIEPYDVVVIYSEAGIDGGLGINERRLLVDTYTCTQTSLNPPLYKYEISLFSETKLLEGIILPSLSITKLHDGTPRTVYEYIHRYVDLYSPKTDSNAIRGAFGNKYTLGSSLARFNSIDCPEMQWNEPTLREVLTDLMMVDDCIPILRNNVIECLDISLTPSEITDTQKAGINYITKSQSSDDYVSEIKMHLINSANNETENNNKATRIVEKIGFRNRESYLLTTENMRLETNFPIWKIFSCKAYLNWHISYNYYKKYGDTIMGSGSDNFTQWIAKDLTDFVIEYDEWLTKEVWYDPLTTQPLNPDYRNTCLYFKRGARDIENFDNKQQTNLLWFNNTIYVWGLIANDNDSGFYYDIMDIINDRLQYMTEHDPDGYTYVLNGTFSSEIRQFDGLTPAGNDTFKYAEFEMDYEAIDNCTFTATKTLTKNKRVIVDNQTNSYIDINRQGLLEYLKAKRLGNKMLLINGRYSVGEYAIPSLASKITLSGHPYTIFRKEISVYNNHIDVNYNATENYILRDYYTGVKSKLRSWRVVSGNEALTRAELIKFYVNNTIASVSNNERVIPSNNINWYLNNFNYCAIQFRTTMNLVDATSRDIIYPHKTEYTTIADNTAEYDTNAIIVEFSKHVINDKSVIFTINMNDNYFAGTYISDYDGTNNQTEQMGIRYCDENGEIVGGYICFYDEIDYGFVDKEVEQALKPLTNIGYISGEAGIYRQPANVSHLKAKIPFIVYKDNKEILQISIQFEVNDEANDIFLGRKDDDNA